MQAAEVVSSEPLQPKSGALEMLSELALIVVPIDTSGPNPHEESGRTYNDGICKLTKHLWLRKQNLRQNRKEATVQEKEIDIELGAAITRCKALLTGPGRAGQFRPFLKSIDLPLGVAKGYIRRFERSSVMQTNTSGEQPISAYEVTQLAKKAATRLGKRLQTREFKEVYLQTLAHALLQCV